MIWQATRRYKIRLFIATIIAVVGISLINKLAYFPGDIQVAKIIQGNLSVNLSWAAWLSKLAEFPWYIILLALSALLAWLCHSFRSGLFVFISFAGLWSLDKLLRLVVFQPRPSSNLIHVVKALPGSAFPSTAAFIYMATFGFLLFLTLKTYQKSVFNKIIFFVSLFILTTVFFARVALGAHWPSDLLLSYLIGIIWISLLIPFLSIQKK